MKIIFKELFNYFHKNELFTKCQSGFLPSNSWISQLPYIVHDINSSFESDPTQDVRGIFSDICKAFDKVWQERLLFKLKSSCVKEELSNLLRSYLQERRQRFVFDGQVYSWEFVKSGVPQEFVIDPFCF